MYPNNPVNPGKVLSDYAGKTLMLRQPSVFKSRYELFLENEVIGTIEKPKFFSSSAVAEIFGTKWEIKRESFWRGGLGVYQYGYEMPMAVYEQKIFGKGFLKLEKGIVLYFNYKIWKGITEIKTESGKILISSIRKPGWKEKTLISIPGKSELLDSKPWIILLISYIEIMRQTSRNAG